MFWDTLCFIVLCPPSDGGSVILIASARGFHVGGQLGNEPVQPVGKIPQQLGIFTLCQENILIPPVCGGRFTLSTQVVLIQVATTQVVRGQFSFHHRDNFLSISRIVFCPNRGRLSVCHLESFLSVWRQLHIDAVRLGKAAPAPLDQPRVLQLGKRGFHGHRASVQRGGDFLNGEHKIDPAALVQPAVCL